MLLVLRLLALTVGIATGYRVLDGTMHDPIFKVPELAVAAALIGSSLLPRGAAPNALTAASAYALGVFSILLAGYLVPGRPVDPMLMAAMAINLCTILLLLPRGGGH